MIRSLSTSDRNGRRPTARRADAAAGRRRWRRRRQRRDRIVQRCRTGWVWREPCKHAGCDIYGPFLLLLRTPANVGQSESATPAAGEQADTQQPTVTSSGVAGVSMQIVSDCVTRSVLLSNRLCVVPSSQQRSVVEHVSRERSSTGQSTVTSSIQSWVDGWLPAKWSNAVGCCCCREENHSHTCLGCWCQWGIGFNRPPYGFAKFVSTVQAISAHLRNKKTKSWSRLNPAILSDVRLSSYTCFSFFKNVFSVI